MIQEPASYCCVLCSGDVRGRDYKRRPVPQIRQAGRTCSDPDGSRNLCGSVSSAGRAGFRRSSSRLNLGLTSLANYMRSEGLGELHFFLSGGFVTSVKGLPLSMYQARQAMEYGFIEICRPLSIMRTARQAMAVCLYPPRRDTKGAGPCGELRKRNDGAGTGM